MLNFVCSAGSKTWGSSTLTQDIFSSSPLRKNLPIRDKTLKLNLTLVHHAKAKGLPKGSWCGCFFFSSSPHQSSRRTSHWGRELLSDHDDSSIDIWFDLIVNSHILTLGSSICFAEKFASSWCHRRSEVSTPTPWIKKLSFLIIASPQTKHFSKKNLPSKIWLKWVIMLLLLSFFAE